MPSGPIEQSFVERSALAPETSLSPRDRLDALWRQFLGKEVEREFTSLISALEGIEGLNPEQWRRLSPEQRQEVLTQVHKEMAKAYHFPEARVVFVDSLPRNIFGATDPEGRTIQINRRLLEDPHPGKAVDTMLHESRHVYQSHLLRRPPWLLPRERRSEVRKWRETPYRDPRKVGFEEYYYHPMEVDAREFAAAVCRQLKL